MGIETFCRHILRFIFKINCVNAHLKKLCPFFHITLMPFVITSSVTIPTMSHLLTKLFDRATSLYEVLKEAMFSLQVSRGEKPQVNHYVVRHALVIKGAQQFSKCLLLFTHINQVHKLIKKSQSKNRSETLSLCNM